MDEIQDFLNKKIIFRTLNYKWKINFLTNGKMYITREYTKRGFNRFINN